MKFIFLILSLFYFALHAKLPPSTMKDIQTFSKKNLNEKSDLTEVKKVLNVLLELEQEDPSRTAVMMLSESYNKNKALYDRAFLEIENKKNKKQLNEIKKIMANFYNQGNG